jgi:hypothetical protein
MPRATGLQGILEGERRRSGGMVMVGWTPHVSHISIIYMYKYAMQKYFYKTTKYEKMSDGFFIFFCLHSKYFLWGLYTL